MLFGKRRNLAQIDELEHRVRRRLGPDHAGIRL
jgi:hypothetical protein